LHPVNVFPQIPPMVRACGFELFLGGTNAGFVFFTLRH
jgi:hypothetical protein